MIITAKNEERSLNFISGSFGSIRLVYVNLSGTCMCLWSFCKGLLRYSDSFMHAALGSGGNPMKRLLTSYIAKMSTLLNMELPIHGRE